MKVKHVRTLEPVYPHRSAQDFVDNAHTKIELVSNGWVRIEQLGKVVMIHGSRTHFVELEEQPAKK